MSIQSILRAALVAALTPLLAASATAGDLSLSFGKLGKKGSFQASYHSGGKVHFGSKYGHAPKYGPKYGKAHVYGHAPRYGYAPVHVHHRGCATHKTWVPGRWETVVDEIWIPGRSERIWVDPIYETRCDPYTGAGYQILLKPGRWKTVHYPGHYETTHRKVWKPGFWQKSYVCY